MLPTDFVAMVLGYLAISDSRVAACRRQARKARPYRLGTVALMPNYLQM